MMSNYKEEPRLIFRDTIQKNLIGPGSDTFTSNIDEEIISNYPLSRYFSGILFPERKIYIKEDTIGSNDNTNSNAETLDGNDNDKELEDNEFNEIDEDDKKEYEKGNPENLTKEYSEANQYFPTNFGLSFCVPNNTKSVNISFSFAKYKQLKSIEAKIEIEEKDYKAFIENLYNPIKNLLVYENGFMFFNRETYPKSGLSVYNLSSRFRQQEQQEELLYSSAYQKVEKL